MNKRFIVVLFWAILAGLPFSAFAQEIMATMGSTSYASGEEVQVTVKNNTSRSVFSEAAGVTAGESVKFIERQDENGVWEKFPATCEWPDCHKKVDRPRELKAGQEVSFEFYPRIYKKDEGDVFVSLKEGVYRLIIKWQERKNVDSEWVMNEVKTPEFKISQ
jgi:hypothetical protein